jgi:acyl phosphate:glycerol-3-phosphate acyltransferase
MILDQNFLIFSSLFVLFGYLVGSIPFGLILTRAYGLGDIRKIGSGNIGATNVLRTGNKKIALMTLLLDGIKGALAIFLAKVISNYEIVSNLNNNNFFECLVGVSAVFGHCYPIWLKFKGGKGVATGFGVILYFDLFVGIVSLIMWLLITKIFKISSLSALTVYILIPILMFINSLENVFLISSIIISCICFIKHKENIKRLLKGSEPKI